ncbi:PREDICTED: beta-mannosidase isoform X2 [Nicrophorus vespilloides]|uniref:beta-mannosidase n=1 Tax=Nicrophorus vespilloides TaxID=110193 RepID=A0ABM1NB04_NICVS|nr:PREDICTED: beta-mannosidase isoform X2 [Nicrophorus vespilloides]
MVKFCALILNTLLQISYINSLQRLILNGYWNLEDSNAKYTNLTGTIPGGIYTDLQNSNVINNIFVGSNDVDTRWVSKLNWNYSRCFEVNEKLFYHDQIYLVFEGIDTFAEVLVNGQTVGTTNNMFVRYEFDVKDQIEFGKNCILVHFKSPVERADFFAKRQDKYYSVLPKCVPNEYHGECHVNHIRKMQASFSWDWGPAFPSMGIWKMVYLEAYNHTIIKDVTVKIEDLGDKWMFNLKTYMQLNKLKCLSGSLLIKLSTDFETIEYMHEINQKDKIQEFEDHRQFQIRKEKFTLWWPNGYGEQKLYKLKVQFVSSDNQETTIKRLRVGIRKIELVQERLEEGFNFFFKVNDIPIFAKGTNMIPISILPELGQDIKKIRYLLQSCKDVHMNMIRIWGGGVYESDELYSVADEMGILIWQDFMFACSMYPTNEEFLNTVKMEVQQQIRRLQHHASIAIWAGNNENEAALVQNWYGTDANFTLYKKDYIKLYVDTVRSVALMNDDSRPFLVSSPTNGIKSEESGFIAKNPQDQLNGDVHYYNYVMDGWDQNIYPVARFVSEYGYQSMPFLESLLKATNDNTDIIIGSKFMEHRQHSPGGFATMQTLISKRLQLPDQNSANFTKAFIFYSQISQAMSIKIETEYYRQWQNKTNSVGKGNTMGALYWQLNDVWAAPSWSGIDFYGNWKMLHYYAKDFFAPVIVTAHVLVNREINVYIISDLLHPVYDAKLTMYTYNWNSFNPIASVSRSVDVLHGSQLVYSFWYDKSKLQCDARTNCFIYFILKNNKDELIAPVNFVLPDALKTSNIEHANVRIRSINQVTAEKFSIQIETNAIAAFVWLQTDIQGSFSRNGFIMVDKICEVFFIGSTTVHELKTSINITHLKHLDYA